MGGGDEGQQGGLGGPTGQGERDLSPKAEHGVPGPNSEPRPHLALYTCVKKVFLKS
jgi:hypothetical protein